jgi:hypothetical protein
MKRQDRFGSDEKAHLLLINSAGVDVLIFTATFFSTKAIQVNRKKADFEIE